MVFDRESRRLEAERSDIRARCGHTNVEKYTDGYICAVCGYRSRFEIKADPDRAREVQTKQSLPSCGVR